jgi:hypothetical protein
MFYFFRRGGASIRCEVRPDRVSDGYELVIDRSDSVILTERFSDPGDLNRRWADLQRSLIHEGWGGPHVRNLG